MWSQRLVVPLWAHMCIYRDSFISKLIFTETFSKDGVVFLSNMFSAEWVELLKTGVSRNLAEPGERTKIWDRNDEWKYTLYDSDNWRRIDEYRKFVFDSSTKEIAAKLLNTSKVNFFYEAIFVRSDGVQFRTP